MYSGPAGGCIHAHALSYHLSHLTDLIVGQFCETSFFALCVALWHSLGPMAVAAWSGLGFCPRNVCRAFGMSPFFKHVSQIIQKCSLEKMAGADASSIITFMANIYFAPNAVVDQKRQAMRTKSSIMDLQNSVAIMEPSGPFPAFPLGAKAGGLIDATPKFLNMLVGKLWWDYIYVSHLNHLSVLVRAVVNTVDIRAVRFYFTRNYNFVNALALPQVLKQEPRYLRQNN